MVSQLTSNPAETTRLRQVSILIQAEHVDSILPFLISNCIPFTVAFTEAIPPLISAPAPSTASLSPKLTSIATKEEEIVLKVYQKYCVEEIEITPPRAEEIAESLGISATKFKALFRKYYGQPFYNLFVEKKMQHAAKLLKSGYKACEVSRRVGYTHPIKFSKMFQKHFGITPKKFQQSQPLRRLEQG